MKTQSPPPAVTKMLTGIQGFDEITDGGLPRARTTLVMGGSSNLVVDMAGFTGTDPQIEYVLADTPSWSSTQGFANPSVINNTSGQLPANGVIPVRTNLSYKIVSAGVSQPSARSRPIMARPSSLGSMRSMTSTS